MNRSSDGVSEGGLEPSAGLLRHRVAIADAVRLPLPDDVADVAIAFMSLHDLDDVRAAVAEVARVLSPNGRFCVALLHPALTARMADGYAVEQRDGFTVEHAGLQMTYEGTHRPLATYFDALETAGFVVEVLREPVAQRGDRRGRPPAGPALRCREKSPSFLYS